MAAAPTIATTNSSLAVDAGSTPSSNPWAAPAFGAMPASAWGPAGMEPWRGQMPKVDTVRKLRQNSDGSWSQGDGVAWQALPRSDAAHRAADPTAVPFFGQQKEALVEHAAGAGAALPRGLAPTSWQQGPAGAQAWKQQPFGGWQAPGFASLAGMQAWGLPGPGPAGGPVTG